MIDWQTDIDGTRSAWIGSTALVEIVQNRDYHPARRPKLVLTWRWILTVYGEVTATGEAETVTEAKRAVRRKVAFG